MPGAVIVKRSFVLAMLLLLSLFMALNVRLLTSAESTATNWLSTDTLHTKKIADLAPNQQPFSMGIDCIPTDFNIGFNNDGQQLHGCAYETPLGTIAGEYVVRGENGTLPINGHIPGGAPLPSIPGKPGTIITTHSSPVAGAIALQASVYDPALFQYKTLWGVPMIYEYQYYPTTATALSDVRGIVPLLPGSVAYSQNGEWLVALRNDGGIERFNTTNWKGKVIAWDKGLYFNETGAMNLAIDNSGQYVALNAPAAKASTEPSLKIYDANSCQDLAQYSPNQNGRLPSSVVQCEYNDIWNGVFRGASYGDGLKGQLPGTEYPRHLRFVGGNILSFDAVYDRVSATEFKVASYQISSGDFSESPKMGLLALGDSYISGEGTYDYRVGTDTINNKCHNSFHAYPYILGAKMSTDYNSVACSGAKTEDIVDDQGGYFNQLRPKVRQDGLTGAQINDVLENFIPGYVNQLQLVREHDPQKVLLSIGGNDIHFSDIIKACVLSWGDYSCFDSSSERKAVLNMVYLQHDILVGTYKKIMDADPGVQLYVVGYPQIAKVGGNCASNVHLNAKEVEFGALLVSRLNATIRNAAESVGVRYVDVENALAGSMLCDVGQAGMNGLTAGDDALLDALGNESYHPTAFGHILLANKISRETSDLTQAMPVATNTGRIYYQDDDPFITGAKDDSGLVRKLSFEQIVENSTVIAMQNQHVDFDATPVDVSPGAEYTIVFHSQLIKVATGTVNSSGNIEANIAVPDIEPGAHTLHIYTSNTSGEPLDIMQVVYVAKNSSDFDGDGIPNSADSCVYVHNTGVDTDGDGTDDTCDGDTAAHIAGYESEPSVDNDSNTNAGESNVTAEHFFATKNTTIAISAKPNTTQGIYVPENNQTVLAANTTSPRNTQLTDKKQDYKENGKRLSLLWVGGFAIVLSVAIIARILIPRID
ncbi:SGNH/GDSL hydrolase family protein [Candidatus Saccharibacteria bacterium]|nr:SGNH/GDSL hydrolase family protein [Candidatus Saccharibacteria bacterium]